MNEQRHLQSMVVVGLLAYMSIACAQPNSQQQIERAQQELNSILASNKNWFYEDHKLGWRLITPPGYWKRPDEAIWSNNYMVAKKGRLHGLIVYPGTKNGKTGYLGLPAHDFKQPGIAFVLADIPKGYLPANNCQNLSVWEERDHRCKVSKGLDCGSNKPPEEMVAFYKMPDRCATDSTLLHSAYRYDPRQGLVRIPVEGIGCVVEDIYRAKGCLFVD